MAPLRIRLPRTTLTTAALGGLVAIGAMLAASTASLAYPSPSPTGQVVSTTCGNVAAGTGCTIVAKFTNADGSPLVGATITWTVSVPPGGTVSPNPSTTGADGTTTVTYTPPPAGTALDTEGIVLAKAVLAAAVPCSGTITGTAPNGQTVSIPVNTTCNVTGAGTSGTTGTTPVNGTLPVTSTGDAGGSLASRVLLAGGAAACALVIVGGVARYRRSRRQAAA